MTRRLTHGERELWERLRQTVKPLTRKAAKPPHEAFPPPQPKAVCEKTSHRNAKARPAPAVMRPAKPVAPALAPFEEKTLRRLRRDLVAIDARIDLHGMRQERAHAVLAAFLRHKQASGAKIVLVVTGKGGAGGDGRGVLRESVPRWLADGEFRHLVIGFEEAHRRHGGAGALYVRVRRRREGAPRSMREA
jgi:DNA-nicking Smr family endonuclease